jgi:hypothetical protein
VHGACGDLAARQALADQHRPARIVTSAAAAGLAAFATARLWARANRPAS